MAVVDTSIEIGHFRFYVDPAMIDRIKLPISRLSTAYSNTHSRPSPTNRNQTSPAPSASELHLEIRKLSARIYSPSRLHGIDSSRRARGSSIWIDAGKLYLERSQGDHIQARLDWLKADLCQLTGMLPSARSNVAFADLASH